MSASLFTMLPCRFALIGGDCARRHVSKVLESSLAIKRQSLSVPINTDADLIVESDLIFKARGLSRIITYIHHPSAICFEPPGAASYSVQIEAASNFLLWLLGKPHDSVAIQRTATDGAFKGHKGAPIVAMRRYAALEKKEQKVLNKVEYHSAFLS